MKKSNKDDAVSPVIGVMLMLVVTIIIAAVVATFASGLGTDIEKAPNAVLDVSIYENINSFDGGMYYSLPSFQILYLAGDGKLDTSKMSISSMWKGNDGKTYTHTASGKVGSLFLYNEGYYSGETDVFGEVVLNPGEQLVSEITYNDYENNEWDMTATPIAEYGPFEEIFGDKYTTIEKGTEISVSITYGNHILFDKVVEVA